MTFGVLRRPADGGEVTFLTDELGELLNGVTLLVFGAVLLWPALDGMTWRIGLYAVASLTVVRMLPVAVAMLGTGARRSTVAFLGWFGPRGLASIVFAVIVVQEADLPHTNTILLTTYVTVGLSVLAHGATAAPLARRYASWFASHPRDAMPVMESVPAGHTVGDGQLPAAIRRPGSPDPEPPRAGRKSSSAQDSTCAGGAKNHPIAIATCATILRTCVWLGATPPVPWPHPVHLDLEREAEQDPHNHDHAQHRDALDGLIDDDRPDDVGDRFGTWRPSRMHRPSWRRSASSEPTFREGLSMRGT